MAQINWPEAVGILQAHVVKLSTPRGSGTGFVLPIAPNSNVSIVATAAHVLDNAHYWEEPIRVQHDYSGKSLLLHANERAVFLKEERDTAALLFSKGSLPLPDTPVELVPDEKHLRIGHEVGWLGYPAVAATTLCFFSGRVSAWLETQRSYLVDGVAINGVSGGPAFHLHLEKPVVIGVVSAYIPNRATGETLPGLCVVRDVQQFQELSKEFATVKEAKTQETVQNQPPPPPEKGADGAG